MIEMLETLSAECSLNWSLSGLSCLLLINHVYLEHKGRQLLYIADGLPLISTIWIRLEYIDF